MGYFYSFIWYFEVSISLDEVWNGYVARDQLLYAL